MITLVLCSLALYLIYRNLKEQYSRFVKDGVPGPTPTLVFGNVAEFAGKDPLAKFSQLCTKFGKVFGYFEGFKPSVVVSDPEMIEQILVKNFHKFDGRPRCAPFQHGPEQVSLQNLYGAEWKQQREAVASALNASNLRQMFPQIQHVSNAYLCKLSTLQEKYKQGFDIQSTNQEYSLDSFAKAAFSFDPDSLTNENNLLLNYMRAAQYSASPENPVSGIARLYPTLEPVLSFWDKPHQKLADEHFKEISQHLQKEKAKMVPGKRPENLLQHLFSFRTYRKTDDPSKTACKPLQESQIQGLVSGMIGGGLGPACSCLDFTLHCLAVNPLVQDKLSQEIQTTCGSQAELTLDKVLQMEYLDMVINETLRLYPIAPGVARTCTEDCVVNGVQFREGTVVRLLGCVQYADPNIFPNPHIFDPERFSKEARSKRHPYSWLPFGNGPRMCVAKRLGLVQVKVAIIKILQNFYVLPTSKTQNPLPVALQPFLCAKDGVFIKLQRRTTSEM